MQILERETKKTMLCVIIALMPALIMAVYNFGARAFILTLVCVAASVLFDTPAATASDVRRYPLFSDSN